MNIIITGATSGIGKAILEKIISEENNLNIVGTYCSDESSVSKIKQKYIDRKDVNLFFYQCDFMKQESINYFTSYIYDLFDDLDWLILNVGVPYYKKFEEYEIEEWDEHVRCNLTTPIFLIKNFKQLIKKNGKIILMGSHAGNSPFSRSVAYNVTKGSINYLCKVLVKELEDKQININSIAPGFIETSWHKNRSQESYDLINKKIAQHRFGQPEEVADITYSVLTNDYINGSVIEIHGGYNFHY